MAASGVCSSWVTPATNSSCWRARRCGPPRRHREHPDAAGEEGQDAEARRRGCGAGPRHRRLQRPRPVAHHQPPARRVEPTGGETAGPGRALPAGGGWGRARTAARPGAEPKGASVEARGPARVRWRGRGTSAGRRGRPDVAREVAVEGKGGVGAEQRLRRLGLGHHRHVVVQPVAAGEVALGQLGGKGRGEELAVEPDDHQGAVGRRHHQRRRIGEEELAGPSPVPPQPPMPLVPPNRRCRMPPMPPMPPIPPAATRSVAAPRGSGSPEAGRPPGGARPASRAPAPARRARPRRRTARSSASRRRSRGGPPSVAAVGQPEVGDQLGVGRAGEPQPVALGQALFERSGRRRAEEEIVEDAGQLAVEVLAEALGRGGQAGPPAAAARRGSPRRSSGTGGWPARPATARGRGRRRGSSTTRCAIPA